jgi:hypothetical protein
MRISHTAAAVLFVLASSVHAQPSPYDGKWAGFATSSTGAEVRVELKLGKDGGSVRFAQMMNYTTIDQCAERDLPVVVESHTPSALTISIKGGAVLKGCLEETATLKVLDNKTLQGTLKDGRSMKLSRE